MSLRDLCVSMLAVIDKAATDVVLDRVGKKAVKREIRRVGLGVDGAGRFDRGVPRRCAPLSISTAVPARSTRKPGSWGPTLRVAYLHAGLTPKIARDGSVAAMIHELASGLEAG